MQEKPLIIVYFTLRSPSSQEKEELMKKIPYTYVVGLVMHIMVCTMLNVVHAISVFSRYV